MNELFFKWKDINDGHWVTASLTEIGILRTQFHAIPDTVCRYTGVREYRHDDRSANRDIYEGDIVEVWGTRRPKWDNPQSQYDGDIKVRGVVEFNFGSWQINYDNDYNHSLEILLGKEWQERIADGDPRLYRYGCLENEDDIKKRERNPKYKFDDIIVIGNIFDDPQLLDKKYQRYIEE